MNPLHKNLTREIMLTALTHLDALIAQEVTLIVGGGSAMILAHGFALGTSDVDAVPKGMDLATLDGFVKQIAQELSLAPDWLNPYYSTFAHTLPSDYGNRLIEIFSGQRLKALALGKEEMLIMKCFAHRQKDVAHARALIKKGVNVKRVEDHIEKLREKGIPGAGAALDFLDDVMEQVGNSV